MPVAAAESSREGGCQGHSTCVSPLSIACPLCAEQPGAADGRGFGTSILYLGAFHKPAPREGAFPLDDLSAGRCPSSQVKLKFMSSMHDAFDSSGAASRLDMAPSLTSWGRTCRFASLASVIFCAFPEHGNHVLTLSCCAFFFWFVELCRVQLLLLLPLKHLPHPALSCYWSTAT